MVLTPTAAGRPTPEELRQWLEWAGARLLALKLPQAAPAGFKTMQLDYADDAGAYGYTAETIRAPTVRPKEVDIMELILRLPGLADTPVLRRVLHLRALVRPMTGKHVHGYKAVGKILHIDERLAARLHGKALAQVCRRIPADQIKTIRSFLKFTITSS